MIEGRMRIVTQSQRGECGRGHSRQKCKGPEGDLMHSRSTGKGCVARAQNPGQREEGGAGSRRAVI